eukprot:s458_g17.t1
MWQHAASNKSQGHDVRDSCLKTPATVARSAAIVVQGKDQLDTCQERAYARGTCNAYSAVLCCFGHWFWVRPAPGHFIYDAHFADGMEMQPYVHASESSRTLEPIPS